MTQQKAQQIIKKEYGKKAYAIGHAVNNNETAIFWIFGGENETDYKVYYVNNEEV